MTVVADIATDAPNQAAATVSEPFSSAACLQPEADLVNT
jgi:hypothetical protein